MYGKKIYSYECLTCNNFTALVNMSYQQDTNVLYTCPSTSSSQNTSAKDILHYEVGKQLEGIHRHSPFYLPEFMKKIDPRRIMKYSN